MTMREPPESAALDNAEAAIIEGKEQVEQQRTAALESADNAAQRDAINSRFDAIDSELSTLHDRVSSAASESVQAAVGPISEQLRGMDAQLAALAAGGAAVADDDGILSIEEIADDAADTIGAAGEAATDAAANVAAEVDKGPKRGHALFRKWWGG